MNLTFKTTDLAKWGVGVGRTITTVEWEDNFWTLHLRIKAFEDEFLSSAGVATFVSIEDFTVSDSQLTINLTNGATQGPYTLPVANWRRRTDNNGIWNQSTAYLANDVFSANGSLYVVLLDHTSSAFEFDPDATDGSAHQLYGLLLSAASLAHAVTESGSSIDLATSHANCYVRCTNVGGAIINITSTAVAALPMDAEIHFRQCTDGGLILNTPNNSDGGVTLNIRSARQPSTSAKGACFTMKKVAAGELDVFGDLTVDDSPSA